MRKQQINNTKSKKCKQTSNTQKQKTKFKNQTKSVTQYLTLTNKNLHLLEANGEMNEENVHKSSNNDNNDNFNMLVSSKHSTTDSISTHVTCASFNTETLHMFGIGLTLEESNFFRECYYALNTKLQEMGESLVNLSKFSLMVRGN